jgi:hypothetical protein
MLPASVELASSAPSSSTSEPSSRGTRLKPVSVAASAAVTQWPPAAL